MNSAMVTLYGILANCNIAKEENVSDFSYKCKEYKHD